MKVLEGEGSTVLLLDMVCAGVVIFVVSFDIESEIEHSCDSTAC